MSQYITGTISIGALDNVVTGVGTAWLTQASAGDMLFVDDDITPYQIAAINSDTELVLSANYPSAVSGVDYTIVRDFTFHRSYPLIIQGDLHIPDILTRALQLIDSDMQGQLTPWGDVLDILDAAPTSGNLVDDAYIVDTGVASGDEWFGHEDDIAVYTGTSGAPWDFTTPEAGYYVLVLDVSQIYLYIGGAWQLWGPSLGDISEDGALIIDGQTVITNTRILQNIIQADFDNIRIDGNTISTTNTNGDLNLTPDGSGSVVISKSVDGGAVILNLTNTSGDSGAVAQLILGTNVEHEGLSEIFLKNNQSNLGFKVQFYDDTTFRIVNQDLTLRLTIDQAGLVTVGNLAVTSIAIGANTLTTAEFAYLDGQNQSVLTTSSPSFAGLTVSGANQINLTRTLSDPGGSIYGSLFTVAATLTADNAQAIYAFYPKVTLALGGFNYSSSYGIAAVVNESKITGAGTCNIAAGAKLGIWNAGTATVTNSRALWVQNSANTGGGSVGTNVGVYIENMTTGATDYAIYSVGGQSYHGGNFGIGMVPTVPLDVTGAIAGSTTITAGTNVISTAGAFMTGATTRIASDGTLYAGTSGIYLDNVVASPKRVCRQCIVTGTTANATPVNLLHYTPAVQTAGAIIVIRYTVSACSDNGTIYAYYFGTSYFQIDAATAPTITNSDDNNLVTSESDAALAHDMVTDGTYCNSQITGKAATNIRWYGSYEITEVEEY